jgi:predicted esterase
MNMNCHLKIGLITMMLCLYASIQASNAQKLPAGPQVLTFFSDADDTEQPYGLYLPQNYDPQKKYPLVIMLHGAGSNHRLALRRVFGKSNVEGKTPAENETDVEASRYFPEWKDVDYIVASPFARGTAGYQGIPEQDVYDVLSDVKRRFSVDEDRVYLTGLSMGGGGTLWLGLSRPDIWAAIAPVCPAPPKGTEALAGNALNYPVHFFQGDEDPAVKVEGTRAWVKRLQDAGTKVEYAEYPGVKHDSWVNAYKDEFIFDWFSKYRRNPFPDQVRFTSSQYKYNNAYWVRLDELNPGTLAKIDVKFTGPNRLEVSTSDLNAFTLNLAGHPKFTANKALEINIDGKKVKTQSAGTITFNRQKGKWIAGKNEVTPTAKKPGAEGPIYAAFSSRHIYVYGTQDNPSPEELKTRQAIAMKAANWSQYRGEFLGRIMFFPRVLADKQVRPSDLKSANLILFGTKETNSLIDQYSDHLPLQLRTSAADYGLFYVFPMNGHYIAVNSGLPWWTGQEAQGLPFVAPTHRALPEFKDYVLFKGSINNIVSQGYFDNNWKLPQSEVKLINTAVPIVLIK